jgi:hypothetical protein
MSMHYSLDFEAHCTSNDLLTSLKLLESRNAIDYQHIVAWLYKTI